MRSIRWLAIGLLLLAPLAVSPMLVFDLIGGGSQCRGTTATGRLAGGVRMPVRGENFRPYCMICVLALRTYGHEKAIAALTASFADLAASGVTANFVYGEIGFPWGGRFPPHRTHRNGLSIDIMAPLRDGRVLPTSVLNRFGYDEEFDRDGNGKAGTIDFEAVARQIAALDAAARREGGRIARVILAPDLQDNLLATATGRALNGRIRFNTRRAWVRHDDHYHVDLAFPCDT